MMIRLKENERQDVIDFLSRNYIKNIYLYIDILMYGLNNDYIKIWVQRNNKSTKKIVLKYYDSFQLYVDDPESSDFNDIYKLVLEHRPTVISGEAGVICKLFNYVEQFYTATYGKVLIQSNIVKHTNNDLVETAGINDMEEIANLICSDQGIGAHYQPLQLKEQLISRYKDRTGRNFVIRDNGRIIAHYGTYAEAPGLAVTGGLIILPEYRGNGYAKLLRSHIVNELIKENKDTFAYSNKEYVIDMFYKLGAKKCSEYGRLKLKKKINK